jgi:hypothetical protein
VGAQAVGSRVRTRIIVGCGLILACKVGHAAGLSGNWQ